MAQGERLTIIIEPKDKMALQELANQKETTPSKIARLAINKYVSKNLKRESKKCL
ncbi:MAG: hypothetical protein U9N33_08190 [Campylobacterota bacterium]|nr:hypothetical protein [Campylobacterota bacterium]